MRAKGTAPRGPQANRDVAHRSCVGAHGTMGSVRNHAWSVLLVLVVACGDGAGTPASCPGDQGTVSFSKRADLDVQVADDDDERERGLMGVTDLPENHGMAFRWDAPTEATFWMKDTLIPLSIAFVGEDGTVIAVREMAPCTADPCTTYGADGPYTMAIEANANWFEDHGIAVGDRVTFLGQICS
jgi:uncharacterized membrane protein (UPF0127 family)